MFGPRWPLSPGPNEKIPSEVTAPLTHKRRPFIVVLVNFEFSGGTPGLNFRARQDFKGFGKRRARNFILDPVGAYCVLHLLLKFSVNILERVFRHTVFFDKVLDLGFWLVSLVFGSIRCL